MGRVGDGLDASVCGHVDCSLLPLTEMGGLGDIGGSNGKDVLGMV
jgi:hypothetical protein